MNEAYWKCRICLSDNIAIPIFGNKIKDCQELATKLRICMGREVPDLEGYPRNLCRDCYEAVNEAYSLINKFNGTSALLDKHICSKDIIPKIEKITKFEIENDDSQMDNIKSQPKTIFIDTQHYRQFLQPLEPKIEIIENENCKADKNNANAQQITFTCPQDLKQELEPLKPQIEKINKLQKENCATEKNNGKAQRRITFTGPQDFKQLLQPLIVNNEPNNTVRDDNIETDFTDSRIKRKVTNKTRVRKESYKAVEGKENVVPLDEFDSEPEENNNSVKKSVLSTVNLKSLNKKPRPKRKRTKHKTETLCELCGKIFQTQDGLRCHIFTHSTKEPLQCPACPKKYLIPDSLRVHMKRMHGEKNLVCSVCGTLFSTTSGLNAHYKSVHLKIRRIIKYPCKLCGKLYATRACALIHERSVHTGERPAICDVCGASFYHENYLQEHRRLHTGETPYKCPVCGRAFAQRGNMKSHIKHNHKISQLDGITISTIDKKYFKYMKP